MTRIIKYFIANPIVGNTLMVGLFILGFFGYSSIKTTLLPELESRMITIQVVYPGSSPEEVEEGIITKIEENLKGVNGIERTTSTSIENAGLVTIEVLKGFDTDLVLRDVKNAVDGVSSFPIGMEPPIIKKEERLGFAISFSLTGSVDLRTLKNFSRQVENELLAIPGISRVAIQGFPEEEIAINFRERDLRKYQLSFDQAVNMVRGANLEVTGGKIKAEREELLIRARNKAYQAEDLQDIVIQTNPDGGVIRLYQVADITNQWADVPSRSYMNGDAAVIVTVQHTLQEDMLEVTEKVRDYIAGFNKSHSVLKATMIQDASEPLNERIQLMVDNGVIGFVLVLVLLAFFLNWRLAFWVALSIPISFAGMFIFADLLGITINMMSLFGMIIVVGILVDDGIVIAENIFQKYENGMAPMQAALEGTLEVLPAVFAAIITTIVAFSGFFFVDGSLGEFGIELAIVVIFSLSFSLLEGILILPAHVAHSKALKKNGAKPNPLIIWLNGGMDFLRDKAYLPVLRFAMNNSLVMIAICIASLAIVVGAFQGGLLRSTFFPSVPSERFTVELRLPAGAREELTLTVLNRIETAAWELSKAYSDSLYNGEKQLFLKIEKSLGPTSNQGLIAISLIGNEYRESLTARDLTAILREKVGPIYEAETLQYRVRSAFGKPVDLSILGSDYDELEKATVEIEAQLKKMTDLRDVTNNNLEGLKEIDIELKPKAYNLGLTLGEVIRQVRQGFFGAEVQRLQRGVDEVKVWVRYQANDRSDVNYLANMHIRTAKGLAVPLKEIATFAIERGVISINHLDGQREVNLEAEIVDDNVSVSGVQQEIQEVILPPILAKYPSVSIKYGGESREQAKTMKTLIRTIGMIMLGIFFIILLTFKSVSQTLIIFALIPFGFVGVGWGHYWMNTPLSMVSLLGFTALIGILVNDALVFVTTFNDKIREGNTFEEALLASGLSRFRPIILTSVTTIAGLGPILLEKSQGAQLLIPMAISVAFGLLMVTIIILALIPALLVVANGIKVWAISTWEGAPVAQHSVEPAFPGRKPYLLLTSASALMAVTAFAALAFAALKLAALIF
ncbi:MAG: efflux RND transporter permease subunit [Saprospiraceae bacterium]